MLKARSALIALVVLASLALSACAQSPATSSSTSTGPLTISTSTLPDGRTGLSYSQTVRASGGQTPYTWSIASGSLPDGFLFSSTGGTISGITQKSGSFAITVQVKDSLGATASQKLTLTIKAATLPLTSGTGQLSDGEVAVNYSRALKAFGGDGNYSWSIANGKLPDGLTLDAKQGTISGVPTAVGKNFFTIKVSDGSGSFATEALTLNISATLDITTDALAEGEVGIAYSFSPEVSNGVPNYLWSVTKGSLPDGLKLDPSSGNISGNPTKEGTFGLTLQVNDAGGGVATLEASLKIFKHVALTTTTLPQATVGKDYSVTLSSDGGNGTVIWANAGGDLPDGLSFDGNTGTLSGTPKTAGKFTVTFQVIDSLGADSMQTFDLVIS